MPLICSKGEGRSAVEPGEDLALVLEGDGEVEIPMVARVGSGRHTVSESRVQLGRWGPTNSHLTAMLPVTVSFLDTTNCRRISGHARVRKRRQT
eukprot:77395-Hanusia_phi.AAC.1